MNVTRRSSRYDSRAHCSDETREKGASRASVAAARRKSVGDAIFRSRRRVARPERSDTSDSVQFLGTRFRRGVLGRIEHKRVFCVAARRRIILSYHICRRVSGPSVSNSDNGIASTRNTTSAFHFVTPSNRRVGRSTSRDVVSVREKTTPERASHQSGGDATNAATLRRAEPGDAAK